jgi:SAM-dependent methyltransferase
MKINFGCGTNHLPGWDNFDAEVDITRPLPFGSGVADFILAEHVVEHVTYPQALEFFRECRRVLKSGGVARIAVPSIEQVWRHGSADYFAFVHGRRWAVTPDRRAAMTALLECHGHRAPWTSSLLASSLYLAGFDRITTHDPGFSYHAVLRNVEGHGRVIGDAFNAIETVVAEGTN